MGHNGKETRKVLDASVGLARVYQLGKLALWETQHGKSQVSGISVTSCIRKTGASSPPWTL